MRPEDFENQPGALAICWAFARGDMAISAFETWLYTDPVAELVLGPEQYLIAAATDFGNARRVADLRYSFWNTLPAPAACECHKIANNRPISMGEFSYDGFDHVQRGAGQMFWLHRFRCRVCAAEWWLVLESRIYDVWICYRGWTNQPAIGTYRELLALAVRLGARVRYAEPEVSVEIPATIEDLAIESPGISLTELAQLLPVPVEVIRLHAERVAKASGVNINLHA